MKTELPSCTCQHTCSVCKKWVKDTLVELTELRQMKRDFQEIRRFIDKNNEEDSFGVRATH